MKTPSPLIPQGTLPTHGRSHVPIIVSTILALHFVLLGALLIAGCKPTTSTTAYTSPAPTNEFDNEFAALPPWVEPTNPTPFEATGSISTPPSAPRAEFVVPPAEPPPAFEPAPSRLPSRPGGTGDAVASRSTTPGTSPGTVAPVVTTRPAATQPTESTHVIVRGDSLYGLAKKYGVTTKALERANPGVDPTRLQLGAKLIIPAAEPPPPRTTEPLVADGGNLYVVRSGDTLWKIANDHKTTVDKLRSENSLRTDKLKVGQQLRIPGQ